MLSHICRGMHAAERLQCDETHPICARCSKAGRVCEYPDFLTLDFKDQTSLASERAVMQWRTRAKGSREGKDPARQPSQILEPSTGSELPKSPIGAREEALLYSPPPPDQDMAIHRFVLDYVPLDQDFAPWLNFMRPLPSKYSASSIESCLAQAVLAISYANLTGRWTSETLRSRTMMQYGQALKALNEALLDAVEATKDETIMSVQLMSLFEAMMSDRGSRQRSVDKHMQGAFVLAKMRGRDIIATDSGKSIFVQLYFQGVSTAFPCRLMVSNQIASSS